MKALLINKVLLSIEIIPVIMLFLLSLLLLGDARLVFFFVLLLSILSMLSLIYLILKTILNSTNPVARRFVYLVHTGLAITVLGLLMVLVEDQSFKDHSANVPFAIFSFGLLAFIPYCHVMLVNNFYKKTPKRPS